MFFLSLVLLPLLVSASVNYQWGSVKIGVTNYTVGGGYVVGLATHPLQQNLVYSRTDVGGAYRLNYATKSWVPLTESFTESTLFGVESIAVDPTNANVVYAAFGNSKSASTGIYSSTNQGTTWTKTGLYNIAVLGNEDYRWAGERLLVNSANVNVLWYGSRQDGLYYSSNKGTSWTQVSGFPFGTSTAPQGITFVAGSGSAIYAGVYGSGVSFTGERQEEGRDVKRGLQCSWFEIYKLTSPTSYTLLSGSPTTPVRGTVASDGTLWVTSDSGVHKYTGSWTTYTPGGAIRYAALSVDPHDPSFVVASASASGFYCAYYTSANAGTTWKAFSTSATTINMDVPWWPTPQYFEAATSSILIDPFDSNTAYMADWFGHFITNNLKATKPTWYSLEPGHEELVILQLASHPIVPLLSGSADVGGFTHSDVSVYPSQHWTGLQNTLGIDFAETNSRFVVRVGTTSHSPAAGQVGGFYSSDIGNTWTAFENQFAYGGRVAVSPDGKTIVWAPMGVVPHYSSNNGSSWTASTGASTAIVNPTSIFNTANPLCYDRVNSNYVYVLDGNDFKMSSNRGATWTTTATIINTGSPQVFARPGAAGEVWVCVYGGLYRSTNYGSSFSKLSSVTGCSVMMSLGKARSSSAISVVYIRGTVGGLKAYYRSEDFGATWVRIDNSANLITKGTIMAADRTKFGRVFVGSSGRGVYLGDDVTV